MGYAVYEDTEHARWAGYGVPAVCDTKGCTEQIDRGLDYKCETYWVSTFLDESGEEVGPDGDWHEEKESEEEGCGLFFCPQHQDHEGHGPAEPKPDSYEWIHHLLTDESWARWRQENPERVRAIEKAMK